jgi:hypothetical protein
MMLSVPPPTRIAIGTVEIAGKTYEVYASTEWSRYFQQLNAQTISNASAVNASQPHTALLNDATGAPDVFPGPSGPPGGQGDPGLALFMLQDDPGDQGFLVPPCTDAAFASPPAIGNAVPATARFTTLTVTAGLAAFNKGASVNGPATLGATGTTQWSFETPVMRYYIGDGTGYSLRFTKRTGSTNTDLFTFTDAGAATISGAFGCNGKSAQSAYALGPAATDLASALTLVNNLRTMSINNGTGS